MICVLSGFPRIVKEYENLLSRFSPLKRSYLIKILHPIPAEKGEMKPSACSSESSIN